MRADLDATRRSLAIGGNLTRSDMETLLEAGERLLVERERIEEILRELGPAWSVARAALNELAAVLRISRRAPETGRSGTVRLAGASRRAS